MDVKKRQHEENEKTEEKKPKLESETINYIECPTIFEDEKKEIVSIFLGGGISGCPDWQSSLRKLIHNEQELQDIVLINPRRAKFDVNDETLSGGQIKWEF